MSKYGMSGQKFAKYEDTIAEDELSELPTIFFSYLSKTTSKRTASTLEDTNRKFFKKYARPAWLWIVLLMVTDGRRHQTWDRVIERE